MGRKKQLQEAKAIWVKVNEQSPQKYLLVPSSGKLNLAYQNFVSSSITIDGIHAAFAAKGDTLLPFESLRKSFSDDSAGSSEANPVIITGLVSATAAAVPTAVPPPPIAVATETDTGFETEPLKLYAPAVKRLVFGSLGNSQTVGTAVLISSDGLFVTSLHCLIFRGVVFLGSFLVDGLGIGHVVSFPALDIFVGRIKDTQAKQRPYLPIGAVGAVGMHYFLVHYPMVVDLEAKQEAPGIPTVTQGVLAAANATQWIGDAESFPNSSGGAACANGQLVAVHTCSLSHEDIPASQNEEEEDFSTLDPDVAWVGLENARFQEGEQPAEDSAGEVPSQVFSPKTLTRRVLRVEANGQHKGTLCGMVPGSLLQFLLVKHKVLKLPAVTNLRSATTSRKRKKP